MTTENSNPKTKKEVGEMRKINILGWSFLCLFLLSCGGGGTPGTAPEPDASVIDNPPTVKILTPLPDLNLSRVINITAKADDDFGIAYVEFFIDDVSLRKVTADPYTLTWDASQSSLGSHTVKAKAVDTGGQAAEDEVTINVSCSYTNEQVETCDGKDNDCDGIPDNGCDCLDGETRQCGESNVGECEFGTQTCTDGQWGKCLGEVFIAVEICDGLDNDCDGISDNGCDCLDGETRQCGDSDVGECEFGVETCTDGRWGECLGAVLPQTEICDGKDNDCDGELDEQPEANASCDNGLFCDGAELCDNGACQPGVVPDCSGLTDQCNSGTCNETVDTCEAQPANEGLACDDSLYCNIGETCQSGTCTGGAPRDCDDSLFCTGEETCDELADSCVSTGDPCPGTECQTCQEDSDSCFDPSGTTCGDSSSSQCDSPDTCDGSGACQPNYVSSGTVCDDGLFCNVGETCNGSGSCAGGSVRDCDDSLFCTGAETCDEITDSCVSAGDPCPGTECQTCQEDSDSCFDLTGIACDDGLYCTINETCDGFGSCVGTEQKDLDGDGQIDIACGGNDCDDTNPDINTRANEQLIMSDINWVESLLHKMAFRSDGILVGIDNRGLYYIKNNNGWLTENYAANMYDGFLRLDFLLDTNDSPHICYFADGTGDQYTQDLWYTTKQGGLWSQELVDINVVGTAVNYMSFYDCRLAMDKQGRIAISYVQKTPNGEEIAIVSIKDSMGWQKIVFNNLCIPDNKGIDCNGYLDKQANYISDVSIFFDDSGVLHAMFRIERSGWAYEWGPQLHYAYKDSNGVHQEVIEEGYIGAIKLFSDSSANVSAIVMGPGLVALRQLTRFSQGQWEETIIRPDKSCNIYGSCYIRHPTVLLNSTKGEINMVYYLDISDNRLNDGGVNYTWFDGIEWRLYTLFKINSFYDDNPAAIDSQGLIHIILKLPDNSWHYIIMYPLDGVDSNCDGRDEP